MAAAPGIDERSVCFYRDVIGFVKTIRSEPGTVRTIEQLVAAAGSIAANRCEAVEASSRKEFIRFNKLALRSAKECRVWLLGCQAGNWGQPTLCATLLDEAQQITRILIAIIRTSQG